MNHSTWTPRFSQRSQQMRRSAVRELLKLTAQPSMISFAGGLPAPELLPLLEVNAAAAAVLQERGVEAVQYGETEGIPELRDWVAARSSSRGRRLTRANVAITAGAQQALDLLGRILLDPGDRVIVENPTYLALLSAWRPLGVEFLGAPGDAEGLLPQGLESLASSRPKLLYTIPNFQNPSGTTLDAQRRAAVLAWAGRHDVTIVEDDPYGELRFEGADLPTLFEVESQTGATENVVSVGSFSKTLAPGLRVGWVVAPEPVIEKLVGAKQAADLHTSSLSQHIIRVLLSNGVFETQLPRLRTAYRERRDSMLQAMARHFPGTVSWTRPQGGMFLLVRLPPQLSAQEILKAALSRGVAFVPGEEFHLNGEGRNTFRLNFSNTSPPKIEEGIERLGELLHQRLSPADQV